MEAGRDSDFNGPFDSDTNDIVLSRVHHAAACSVMTTRARARYQDRLIHY